MTGDHKLGPVQIRLVEDFGNITQAFGLGRAVGQIFAYLYTSPVPRTLSDMQSALGISKGSASMCVRQLEQWEAVKKVWIKGDRRDYYEAGEWFGQIIRNAMMDTMGKRISLSSAMLDDIEVMLGREDRHPDSAFLRERVGKLRKFESKVKNVFKLPMLVRLFGL